MDHADNPYTHSRGPPVEPPPFSQAAVVPRCLHLPSSRSCSLLAVLEPQVAHEGLWVRAGGVRRLPTTAIRQLGTYVINKELRH